MFKIYRTYCLKILFFVVLIIAMFSEQNRAKALPDLPLEITLSLSNSTLDINNHSVVKVTLVNNSPFEVFDIGIDYQSENFNTKIIKNPPLNLASFTSAQGIYQIMPRNSGSHRLGYSTNYSWKDDNGVLHNRIEVVDSGEISIYKDFGFDWPSYLIPLIIGFVFGQIGTLLTDWYRYAREIKLRVEQATGILSASIQTAKKCLEKKEEISFSFWEDLIVKENLYPSLVSYGKKVKHPDLAKRFANLSTMIKEYNSLRLKGNLSEDFVIDIEDEIQKLIAILENS